MTPRTAASDSLISSRNLETRGCSVTIVTSALNVLGFNLRYTPDLLEHTHGHVPFDNRDVVYADAGLDQGIQRWAGSPDALNYIEQSWPKS